MRQAFALLAQPAGGAASRPLTLSSPNHQRATKPGSASFLRPAAWGCLGSRGVRGALGRPRGSSSTAGSR